MDIKKELIKNIDLILKQKRLIRKNTRWYFKGKDLIISINLQKSQWSNGFYLNVYIYDLENLENDFPVNFYDYNDRLENIFKSDTNLKKIYEFDNLDEQQTNNEILNIKFIIEKYSDFLTSLGDYEIFKNFIIKNNKQNYTSLKIRNRLGL